MNRTQRAMELYEQWRSDPSNFSVRTRVTGAAQRARNWWGAQGPTSVATEPDPGESLPVALSGGYSSSIPIRPDWVVTVANVPTDLTPDEAERLAKFVRMLAVG